MISLNFNINIYQIQQDRMQNSNFMVLYSWQIERGVYMKKMFLRFGQCFAALAFVFATVTANSSCMIIAHQPEEPESVKNFGNSKCLLVLCNI